jgi:ferredoxin
MIDGTSAKRLPNNVDGKYYVTEDCDGCAYCASVAPDNFEFDKSTNTYFISKQPTTQEEIEFVQEAMEDCPVDAVQAYENCMQGHLGQKEQ